MSESDAGFQAALEEAKQGAKEGGIPIGAALVGEDGKILGRGHNMRIQNKSAILHVRTFRIYSGVDLHRASIRVPPTLSFVYMQ